MKRQISIILVLCVLVCTLTGCDQIVEILQNIAVPAPAEKLEFTLTQQMVDDFYTLLKETEEFCLTATDADKADEMTETLNDALTALSDQYQIAYINYCIDQTDEEQKQIYLDCVDMLADIQTVYNDMCKNVYQTNEAIRDRLFEDWSQEEIDLMLKRNEEIAQLDARNQEIVVEFRDLEEDDDWAENMVALYNELVRNNDRIAEIYGYQSYYEYAYQMVYNRDYGQEEIESMRGYVASYLPETFDNALQSFQQSYERLDEEEQMLVSQLIFDSYGNMEQNYVMLYLQSVPESFRAGMGDMFDSQRVIFTSSPNSYAGAFTTVIAEKPFCYYGPGYDSSMTLIHELGHYYGCSYADMYTQPMDLSETQSQGNEWLFTRFMENYVSSDVYQVLVAYKLVSDIGNIICFPMIDEFEQIVYGSENPGNMTVAEYEAIMEGVAEAYGGIDYISENIMDIQTYWKYVVLESPVYYISYAVSGITAVNLFTIAEKDSDKAFDVYIKLIEEPLEDGGFLDNIRHAGLSGPFEETVYRQLSERYANS